ncbi:MAG: hypothetical protein ACXV7C_09770, partial [Candidatus Angelobacter sp.]
RTRHQRNPHISSWRNAKERNGRAIFSGSRLARLRNCIASVIFSGSRTGSKRSAAFGGKRPGEKPNFERPILEHCFPQNLTNCLSHLRSQQLLFPVVKRDPETNLEAG